MDDQEKILDFVEDRLFKDGINKTTMSDLASEMKISKKTIYKFFPSKEEIIRAIAKRFMNRIRTKVEETLKSSDNAVVKISGLISTLGSVVSKVGDNWVREIRQSHPGLWQEIDNFRTKMIIENVTKVIEQGKAEGLIHDYPTSIIITIYVAAVRAVIQPEFVINNNFSLKEAIQHTFQMFMNGILTDKGKEIFNKTINENKTWKS